MARLNLSPPWYIFVSEVEQLFKNDKEVHVIFNDETYDLSLYVEDDDKAEALSRLLPPEKNFGSVTVNIHVVPANDEREPTLTDCEPEELYELAFDGNPILSFIWSVPMPLFSIPVTYVVFRNEVVQYYNDDLSDVYGFCSTLYQNIAKDVFLATPGVFFCTDKPDSEVAVEEVGLWP